MIGAIIGDIIGSVHEFKKPSTKTKDFPLFVDDVKASKLDQLFTDGHGHKVNSSSHFTDDTVCSVGMAWWLLERNIQAKTLDPSPYLRSFCKEYPQCGYGAMFSKWVMSDTMGPYQSWGNGAPMRVAPVGWVGNSLEEIYDLATQSAVVTHDHPEAIKGAKIVAGMIFLLRKKATLDNALNKVLLDCDPENSYQTVLNSTLDQIRPTYTFKVSSQETVPQALLCLKEATSFEDAIRNAISLGGDADTLAAIVGSMAEPLFGVPTEIRDEALKRLPEQIKIFVKSFELTFCR